MVYNNNMKTFEIPDALISLTPGAQWSLTGDQYDGLNWLDEEQTQPTQEAVEAEIIRLQEEYDALEYARLRSVEYPPMADYLDGIVKNDQAQIDAYIAACLAVKEKYPKP